MNQLATETSPYLRQHADNPVDWLPWGDEALAKARAEDKPVLLSVGYSSCHWCHVMAHESFEDADTAEVMNRHFINIKVDREERPDLDRIYQLALQMITQRSGGWPLTMFLNPHTMAPFYGGTYFPKQPRYGLPPFADLLVQVADYYRKHRDEIDEQNNSLLQAFASINPPGGQDELTVVPLDMARQELEQAFDETYGGFGDAPKFPHPPHIERLLRRYAASLDYDDAADDKALQMITTTLVRMAFGGIYDHLGGGFSRYSVDQYWMIPHFEKMLYDNAQLLALYADAHALTGQALFKRVCTETADWIMRRMQAGAGGYYSSLDADSEGEEGRYYVWDPDEIRRHLNEDDSKLFMRRYGLDRDANFEGDWHLFINQDIATLAGEFGTSEEDIEQRLDRARAELLAERQKRIPPGLDDKILTSWNALMIRGMVIAARHLDRPDWLDSAQRALDFIRQKLWRDGRLLATAKGDEAHLTAYLDDYAFLLDAMLELLQLRWNSDDFDFACQLADTMLEFFYDQNNGGFYFTAHDHETLMYRPKTFADDALPSGNGVAARAIQRLGYLLGEMRYLDAAEQTLQTAWPSLSKFPHAHDALLNALEEYLEPPQIIILRGTSPALDEWHDSLLDGYRPRRMVLAIDAAQSDLPEAIADKKPLNDIVAYVCQDLQCSAPVTDPDELSTLLEQGDTTDAPVS